MRQFVCALFICLIIASSAFSQISSGVSKSTMVFDDFHPAVITMNGGKKVSVSQANIFLKGGCLLYKKGKSVMAANMDNVYSVDFGNSHYVRVDTMLAEVVDTIAGNDVLLCSTIIDLDAYTTMMVNSRNVTNLEIRSMVNVASIDLIPDEDKQYPLVKYYFYSVDGKIVDINERSLLKITPKDKRRIFKSLIAMPDFSWGDPQCLTRLLKAIR
jgi:hypothetical protein